MLKKSVALLAFAAMLITMFIPAMSVAVSAAGAIQFTLSNVSGKIDDTVEVGINISANSYLVNSSMFIEYDPTKLEVQNVYDDDEGG